LEYVLQSSVDVSTVLLDILVWLEERQHVLRFLCCFFARLVHGTLQDAVVRSKKLADFIALQVAPRSNFAVESILNAFNYHDALGHGLRSTWKPPDSSLWQLLRSGCWRAMPERFDGETVVSHERIRALVVLEHVQPVGILQA
jgi:hypothetical protein